MTTELTPGSGNFGVDLVVFRSNGERVAVQAKNKVGSIGNADVQKLDSGRRMYDCTRALMICTSSCYTKPARKAAKRLDVQLWGMEELRRMLRDIDSRF